VRHPTLPLLLACACSAPPDPIDPAAVAAELRQRAMDPRTLAQALELAELGPLPFARPDPAQAGDADGDALWHLCAILYHPDVRAARAELAVSDAALRVSGQPLPSMGEVMNMDLENPDRETELQMTFDLLGILGIGKSAAARELADAERRAALARLERALWRATFAVDRARVGVAAVRVQQRELQALQLEAANGLRRAELLGERGWIGAAPTAAAAAVGHRLQHELAATHTELARMLAELARAAGLAPQAPPLTEVSRATLARIHARPRRATPDDHDLLTRHPELRPLLLQHAVAEAGVRNAAASAWPDLFLGPDVRVQPGETLWGGMLEFRLPWPSAVDAAVDQAVAERARTRVAVEDALLAQWNAIAAARERAARADEILREHVPARDDAARRAWAAARARFDVDPQDAMAWTAALVMRLEAIAFVAEAERDAGLARLELAELLGPEPVP
jgi:hypothetical protein